MNHEFTSRTMRGRSQEHMLRRRDAAGGEMEVLARLMNAPEPNNEEIVNYITRQAKRGHIPRNVAIQILRTMPHHPEELRSWAHSVFALIAHQGIHAHAAFPRDEFPRDESTSPQQAASADEDEGNDGRATA